MKDNMAIVGSSGGALALLEVWKTYLTKAWEIATLFLHDNKIYKNVKTKNRKNMRKV